MEKTKKPIGTLQFFAKHAKGQAGWFILALVAMLFATAASFMMPQVFMLAVDSVLGDKAAGLPMWIIDIMAGWGLDTSLLSEGVLPTQGQSGAEMQWLMMLAVTVLVIAVTGALATFVSGTSVATGSERFCQSLRDKLYAHIQYLPFSWQVKNQTGDTIQRCTSDLDVVRSFASTQLLQVLRTLVMVIVAFWLMFSMNVTLSIVALIFVPLTGLYSTIFYKLVGNRFLVADEAEGELTVMVQENLTGVRVVRAFGREKYELDKFDKQNNNFANLWIKLGHTMSVYWGIGDVATGMQIFSIVLAGIIMASYGEITMGEFLVFVSYNQSLAWPVRALGRTLSEMSKTGVSAQRIQEILNAQPEEEQQDAKCPSMNCDIRFENVTFAYEDNHVLKDLSFTIKKGTTFGILGATGSGKSTITYLLNRLYELQEGFGDIWFGDTEIRQIDRYYLRKHVGLVLQEPFLFSKTIEENIAITAKQDTYECSHVHTAAGIASVDDAIRQFTNGYDTMVGERGVTLSGGQKQRVAIARTLMLNAPVMIFDDSMSAVDLETDAKIRASLKENTQDATVILISHRINTLMHADMILVLEDGKIADIGTHAQLIKKEGTYKRIYNMQSEVAADVGARLEDFASVEEKQGGAV